MGDKIMLLDIIVPHYNESWDIVKPFVDMIHSQRGVDFNDFRVIIVHDGVEPFPDEYLDGPAHFVQLTQPKSGVSAARNFGLDFSDAKWVNFSDCDDCYSSIFALWIIFRVLRNDEQFDLLWSPFYMIKDDTLKWFKDYNAIFIHNKYYRRSFLKEKNLRFCEKLYMSEDSAFNSVVEMHIEKGKIGQINVNDPVYAWCRRKGSITMDPERWIKNAEGHFERNLYILEECKKFTEARPDFMSVRTVCDAYSMLNQPRAKGDIKPFEKRVAEFYIKNKHHFLNVKEKDLERLLKLSDLESGVNDAIREERIPFRDWLTKIENEFIT